jgi:hypothetical protein
MTRDRYEPNRFLGFPVGRPPHARQGEEPQRMMGIPVDWLGRGPADRERSASMAHPVRTYRRWLRWRRLGSYAADEGEPRSGS